MSSTPIPILLFTHSDTRGGAEEHMLQLLNHMDRAFFRPHLACTPELAKSLRKDLARDVEVFPLRLDNFTDVAGARKLARTLRQRRIQILHSHQFRASFFASPVGWLCRVPVIIETSHGRELWRKSWLKSRFFVDRVAGYFVGYYIAVSESTCRYLIDQKGLPPRKIHVIHNGTDLSRFSPQHAAPAGMKQTLGFAPADPVMLCAGRLEPQKGHRVLLDALPEVLREFPQAGLICAGDGSLREELERHAEALQIRNAVRFVGYQANITDWLALADFSVLPSYYEGLPLVAMESLAAGRTMVATAVDGTPEVVVDGRTGLTVPSGDSHALALAILRLLREPELRRQLSQAGRQWVLDRFSFGQQLKKTQELYLQAWEERKRGTVKRSPQDLCEKAAFRPDSLPSPHRHGE